MLSRLICRHTQWSVVSGASHWSRSCDKNCRGPLRVKILTDGVKQSGAGRLDHHVGVEEDGLEQRLGERGQLGDQRGQPEVDTEAIVGKVTYPDN